MPVVTRIWELLNALTPVQLTAALAIASTVLYMVQDRRISLVALSVQYLLLGIIIGAHVYRPILYLFLGIGMAVFLVLLLSANRVEHLLEMAPATQANVDDAAGGHAASEPFETMGPLFSAMALILAGVAAFELWSAFPLEAISRELSLASYWLIASGLVLALISNTPLRIGYGLLTFVNGIISTFLVIERSLVVFALVCCLYGVLCVGIVVCTEAWLVSERDETAP